MTTRYFGNLHDWLISEDFSSTRQARLHKAYVLWLSLISNPLALAGLVVVVALVIVSALAPLLSTHDPIAQDLAVALRPPSSDFWFGTGEFGRDVYSRLIYGARTTLYISILVTVIVGPIGFVIGATAGYLGDWVDIVLMHHRYLPVFPESCSSTRLLCGPRSRHRKCGDRNCTHCLAADRPIGTCRDTAIPPGRFRRGGRAPRSRDGAHPSAPHRAALRAVHHHPPDAKHVEYHFDCGWVGLPRPCSSAANA